MTLRKCIADARDSGVAKSNYHIIYLLNNQIDLCIYKDRYAKECVVETVDF